MGWIEVEVGILGLGCILARFWVTDCSYDKCVLVVLGSHQIKKVYAQARVEKYQLLGQLLGRICMNGMQSINGMVMVANEDPND